MQIENYLLNTGHKLQINAVKDSLLNSVFISMQQILVNYITRKYFTSSEDVLRTVRNNNGNFTKIFRHTEKYDLDRQ